MRVILKAWQSDRPMKRDSRRVRGYEGSTFDDPQFRLEFIDENGKVNFFSNSRIKISSMYDDFRAGRIGVLDVMREKERLACTS